MERAGMFLDKNSGIRKLEGSVTVSVRTRPCEFLARQRPKREQIYNYVHIEQLQSFSTPHGAPRPPCEWMVRCLFTVTDGEFTLVFCLGDQAAFNIGPACDTCPTVAAINPDTWFPVRRCFIE